VAVDLILSFFATPGASNARAVQTSLPELLAVCQPQHLFTSPTRVMSEWPMDPCDHECRFKTLIAQARDWGTGRMLPSLVATAKRRLGITEPIGRIAVVTFSAGRKMAAELLKHPDDRAAIDAVIDLDGLTFQRFWDGSLDPEGLDRWVHYGMLCADGTRLLVNWHTAITPVNVKDVASTTEANDVLYDSLRAAVAIQALIPGAFPPTTQPFDPKDLAAGPPPPAAYTPGQNDIPRTWDEMPPLTLSGVGNAHRIAMPGRGGGAHIFSAYWGQGAVWRTFLVPRWNNPEKYHCTSSNIAAPVLRGYGHPAISLLAFAGPNGLGASGDVCVPNTTKAGDLDGGRDLSNLYDTLPATPDTGISPEGGGETALIEEPRTAAEVLTFVFGALFGYFLVDTAMDYARERT